MGRKRKGAPRELLSCWLFGRMLKLLDRYSVWAVAMMGEAPLVITSNDCCPVL